MRKKNYKGRCIKKSVGKAKEVCKTYDDLQFMYLDTLQDDEDIAEIHCNIQFENEEIKEYTTDFVCVKSNSDLMIRECVYRSALLRPKTAKLLDASRVYWLKRGVTDWGLVVDAEK